MKRTSIENILSVVIVIAVGVFYLTSLHGVFLFDDFPAIFKNTNVTGSRTVFSGHRWLVNLTFRINWLITGDDPVLYHVANLLIHIGSALLLFGVVRRTLRRVTFNRQSDGRVVSALSAFSVALIWPQGNLFMKDSILTG